MRTSVPNMFFHATKDGHKPPRSIHPYQASERLESKGADPFLSYRMRRIRPIRVAKERPPKTTASVPRKVSTQLKHDNLTPLIHTYTSAHSFSSAIEHRIKTKSLILRKVFTQEKHESLAPLIRPYKSEHPFPSLSKHPVKMTSSNFRKVSAQSKHYGLIQLIRPYNTYHPFPSLSKHPVKMTSSNFRKFFARLIHDNLAPLIRTDGSDTPLPPATEHPPRITGLARRKILAHFKRKTLAPLIRRCISDHLPSATEYPPGKTSLVPRKVFAQLVCDNLDPIIGTQKLDNSFLPPQSESVEIVGMPRIRLAIDGRPVALPIQSQSQRTQAAHMPNVPEEVIPRELNTDSFIRITLPPISEPPRGATEMTSEAWGEDEPSSDELASWLDELHALVSETMVSGTPDVTTKTGFSSSKYPARPPASSWNPMSNRQTLEYSKMSFSTWSSKAANRYYATAAVSKN